MLTWICFLILFLTWGVWGRGEKNVLRLLWVLSEVYSKCSYHIFFSFSSPVVTLTGLFPFSLYLLITLNRHRDKLATFFFFLLYLPPFPFFSIHCNGPRFLLCIQLNVGNSLAYGRIVIFVCIDYLFSNCHLHRHSSFTLKNNQYLLNTLQMCQAVC